MSAPLGDVLAARRQELAEQIEKLAGKRDHFSVRERERLQKRLEAMVVPEPSAEPPPAPGDDEVPASNEVEEAATAPAADHPAPVAEEPKEAAQLTTSAPIGQAGIFDPEVMARAKAGRERYWAERRLAKATGKPVTPMGPRKKPAKAPYRQPAPPDHVVDVNRMVPGRPEPQHWEVYVGPPRDVEARRLREVMQRARGVLGQQRYAGTWVDPLCAMLDEALKGGAS